MSHVTHVRDAVRRPFARLAGDFQFRRFPIMDRSGHSALRFPCSPRRTATRRNDFALHRLAAYALIILIGIDAALFHYLVRKDGVMLRML